MKTKMSRKVKEITDAYKREKGDNIIPAGRLRTGMFRYRMLMTFKFDYNFPDFYLSVLTAE